MFVEGALWIVRTGSPWRDLPAVFGGWNSVLHKKGSDDQACDQALGQSRGGLSTKVNMAVGGRPYPSASSSLPDSAATVGKPKPPIEGLAADLVMADAAYDSGPLRQTIAGKGARAVIPNNPSRAGKHRR